jgi:hypothetical protein
MKEMISVRSNACYIQAENEFALKPVLEIIIIHTDGKNYKFTTNELKTTSKIAETRFIVNPEMLNELIVELQLHQKKWTA